MSAAAKTDIKPALAMSADAIARVLGMAARAPVRTIRSEYGGGRASHWVSVCGQFYGPINDAVRLDLVNGYLPDDLGLEPVEDPYEVEEREAEDAREAAAIRAHNRLYGPEI